MEGLFIIIAIVIGIFDFAAKQQKKQGGGNRPQGQVQKQRNIPQSLRRAITELEKSMNQGMGDMAEQQPLLMTMDDNEGVEHEDRRKTGSLMYIEQTESTEGVCDEHPEHKQQDRNNRLTVNEAAADANGDFVFDLTEESLLKSIVMAEVLGPPRAVKRRIR